jgi:uncharacterized protein (DUF1015 family)
MLALDAHAEPVLLAYRGHAEIDRLGVMGMEVPPLYDFTAVDGVRHTVWRVTHPAPYVDAFREVSGAYVADGHHRSASAWRAARARRAEQTAGAPGAEYEWFPAVLVPAGELRILAYNRLITDLGGRTWGEVLNLLAKVGRLSPTDDAAPPHPRSFCIYLERRWYVLELDELSINRADPVHSLDVALLQERVLGPVFGIEDQRTDKRIDFVGGIRGPRELEARVNSGEAAVAVSMFPTAIAELMAVADAGRMMPPKSTWFEPKLLSGLFIHTFD